MLAAVTYKIDAGQLQRASLCVKLWLSVWTLETRSVDKEWYQALRDSGSGSIDTMAPGSVTLRKRCVMYRKTLCSPYIHIHAKVRFLLARRKHARSHSWTKRPKVGVFYHSLFPVPCLLVLRLRRSGRTDDESE